MSRKKTEVIDATVSDVPTEHANATPGMDGHRHATEETGLPSSSHSAATLELNPPQSPAPEKPHHSANGDTNASREAGDEKEYPPEPNPRAWAENADAGVQFRTRREPFEAELVFKDKPTQQVIDFIKDNGFRWNREAKVWTRPVNYSTQAQDRLIASRTYNKAVEMILKEKGLVPQKEELAF